MADAVRQIRHDLEQIEKAVDALGEEFNQVYDNYLTTLQTSVQKQVILACYHLCTQSYPERFLVLSYRQRETLQQAIQRYIQELQRKIEHAYVLATISLVKEEEEEIVTRSGRRRSLPSSERSSRRRGRGDSRNRRDVDDDSPDRDGPSIELIAITNMDGDDALDAAKDPFLAAALSEFADSLALDEEAILDRVKQELLRKATRSSSSQSIEGESKDRTDADADTDADVDDKSDMGAAEKSLSQPTTGPESTANPLSESSSIASGPSVNSSSENPQESESSVGSEEKGQRSEVSAIALSSLEAKSTPVDKPAFPDNPDGKRFADCDETLIPDILAARQEQLELNLAGFLRELSKQINNELHNVGMIPKKIPGAVLRAALQTDMSSEFNGSPNILNLLVEAEGKSKGANVMKVTALRLRPQELEFSDPQLSACRSRIRELTGKLQKLGKQYHKKLRDKAIAEAESAWRSSWYENKD
ncbi:MAG: hypothetical protein AAGD25_05165 [Cyanobacteria bacterium P01_F01_bin.150]